MTRTMADSITSADIPTGFPLVAYYVDGVYAWSDADRRRHQASKLVGITVGSGTLDAAVADVESGDYDAAGGAAWLARKVAAGQWGVLYFSRSRFPEIHAAVLAAGVHDDQWGQWVADWTGIEPNPLTSLAVQYANPTFTGGHYDLSLVADYWAGVDLPSPTPAPTPAVVLEGYLRVNWPDFWNRADIAAAWLAGHQSDVFGEWFRENYPDFYNRADIAAAWAAGRFSDVLGEFLKEFSPLPVRVVPSPFPPPAPAPTPPPAPGPPIDQTRSAWANLAAFLTQDLPAGIAELLRLLGLFRKTP